MPNPKKPKKEVIDLGVGYDLAIQIALDRKAMETLARQLKCLRDPRWIKWLLKQLA